MGAILVVGATGHIGGELVAQLVAARSRVRAAVHTPEKARPLERLRLEVVPFDLDRPATFDAALDDVDRAFVLAPPGDIRPVERLGPFFERMRGAGVRRVVLVLPRGLDEGETSPVRAVERRLEGVELDRTVLRPSWLMQNFNGFLLERINREGVIAVPAGEGRTSFVDARDVATVARRALAEDGHEGKAYVLTGPEALSYAEAAAILSEAAGRQIRYVPADDEDLRESLRMAGWPERRVEMMSALYAEVRRGRADLVDPTLEELLGRPPTRLLDYARDYGKSWR